MESPILWILVIIVVLIVLMQLWNLTRVIKVQSGFLSLFVETEQEKATKMMKKALKEAVAEYEQEQNPPEEVEVPEPKPEVKAPVVVTASKLPPKPPRK
jgi:predicted Holliday junction resolvase-like endonuclease